MDEWIRRKDAIEAINKALDRETLLYGLVRKIAVDAIRSLPSADRHSRVYGYLKERLGDIVDSETEFDAWFKRMVWHVEECNRLTDRLQGDVDAVAIFEREMHNLEQGYITIGEFDERIEPLRHLCYGRPQGEWIDAEIPLESGGSMPIQACNLCKTFYPLAYTGGGHRFCPNCGARMKGADDETD